MNDPTVPLILVSDFDLEGPTVEIPVETMAALSASERPTRELRKFKKPVEKGQ